MARPACCWFLLGLAAWLTIAGREVLAQAATEEGSLVVQSATAKVVSGDTVVAEVRSGQRLAYTKRNGDWYFVEVDQNGVKRQGWINREQVRIEPDPAQVIRPRSEGEAAWLKKQVMMTHRRPKLLKLNETTGQTEVIGEVREVNARVDKIQGDWLWVRTPDQEGWITRNDAVPMEEAIEYFTRRIEYNANDAFAYNARGVAWHHHKEFDKALADLNEAIRLSPSSAHFYDRGVVWQAKKEFAKALADYDEALRLDPRFYLAYCLRGELYTEQKENDKAIADYSKAIEILPGYAKAYANRGWRWLAKKDYDRAFADFSDSIRLDPKLAGPYRGRARVYSFRKQRDKALDDLSDAIRLDPAFTLAYVDRASAWRANGDFKRSLADANEAVRLDPQSVDAYTQRALAHRGLKHYDLAISDWSEAIRLNPHNAGLFASRGYAQFLNKDYDKAIADLDACEKLDPQNGWAHRHRALLLAACPDEKYRDVARAAAELKKAQALLPPSAELYEVQAVVAAAAGNLDQAVHWQEEVLKDPAYHDNPEMQQRLENYRRRQQ